MKKSLITSNSKGNEMYQDPKEAEMHFRTQKEDFRRYANDILDIIPIRSGKLLDVGCGFGWVVAEAEKRGFESTGIDQGKAYVSLGKKKLKAKLIQTSLDKFTTDKKYNVIVINHVLEHIKKPKPFLAKIHKLLIPGGCLFVACPNINSMMYWIFRERWYGLQPAQHYWQFTGKTLPALLAKHKFTIKKIYINNMDYKPKSWKKVVFWLLIKFANLFKVGDQVVVLCSK